MARMWRHLLPLSLAEWRHHPWRHAAALLAVALGVALASSVQMINESALGEFAQAVRAVNGQPDLVLTAEQAAGLDDALFGQLARDEAVATLSPVLELDSAARAVSADGTPRAPSAESPAPPASGTAPASSLFSTPGRVPLRVVGIDALVVAGIAPQLLPRPAGPDVATAGLAALIGPGLVFLNPAAQQRLGVAAGDWMALQSASGWQTLRVGGSVSAGGGPLAVMDIAAVQSRFGLMGRLSRIDMQLQPGTDREAWQRGQALPAGARWSQPDEAVQRVSNLSRAYRVNLGVLALVALLVGGFLVYSVVSLSVAQRTPSLALLGVLGLAAEDRRRWVLAEALLLGLVGSALGLAGGAALAALALRLLGGDLGGGYFPGMAPVLAWPWPALVACGVLGTLAAVVGAWWPARQAQALAPALALKGLGQQAHGQAPWWPGIALLAMGGLLALAPPVAGLPLAAYAAIALLLAGGVVLVPAAVGVLTVGGRSGADPDAGTAPDRWGALTLLALRRAHFARHTASATVAGVVASLALSVAITVMVASFRDAVADWLDTVLPADLYARSAASLGATDQAVLPPALIEAASRLPGVVRVQATRQVALRLDPAQPALALVARPLGNEPGRSLPLLGDALPPTAGELGVYASEPAAAIYHWSVGDRVSLPLPGGERSVRVLGIWRDYARQFGAVAIDLGDYQRISGDTRLNDLALWLAPGAAPAPVQAALRNLAGPDLPLDIASTRELRTLSLAIFDRSFAVTLYLQAVAIGVGLVGVAASLSAQVLARRKEFGLLAHLGFTRRQVMQLVAMETTAWLLAGVLVGLALGLLMALVLVMVVNPQSFHWTMPLRLPAPRLALLAGAVLAAGIATALLSARRAAGQQAVLAVKEDW